MTTSLRLSAILLLATLLGGCSGMMKNMMLTERQSPYNLDETVAKISERAKEKGWTVSAVKEMDKTIKKHGGPDIPRVTLIELCHPQHAGKLLADDDSRYVSVMMPCTISVYEKSDGKTYVTNMNSGKIGGMLGGVVAEVMGGPVHEAQSYFLEFLAK